MSDMERTPRGPSRWAPRAHLIGVSAGGVALLWRAVETMQAHWTVLAVLAALPLWALTVHAAGRSFDLRAVRDIVRAVRTGR